MKSYAVIGLGRFGSALSRQLCKLGAEVLALDVRADFVQQISGDVTHAVVGDAQDKEVLLQREKIARMNEIQIAMKGQGERMQDCAKVLTKYEKPFHISWVDRLWNNLKQLLSGVKHWTGLK